MFAYGSVITLWPGNALFQREQAVGVLNTNLTNGSANTSIDTPNEFF